MGAVAACTLGAPISTVIMIFELTGDYGVTFAVMITVAVAAMVWQSGAWALVLHLAAGAAGDQPAPRAATRACCGRRRVARLMRKEVVTVGLDEDLERLKALFLHRHLPIFVVDERGRLFGSIAFEDLADAAFDRTQEKPPTARDLVHRTPIALVPDDDLETALRLCEMNDEEHMPVVDDGEQLHVIGEVRHQDMVLAYNRALLAARAEERGES